MASDMLLNIHPLVLIISVIIPIVLSCFFASKSQGNVEKLHLLWICVISIISSFLMKLPLMICLAIGIFGCVVYSFQISKY